jgi:hypothetical protein
MIVKFSPWLLWKLNVTRGFILFAILHKLLTGNPAKEATFSPTSDIAE